MPKTVIDYSNTIIYKITCKNPAVTDVYVGHTTNFVQRKHAHKQSCISTKSANHNCKLYQVMRNNGGWENWKMEIINFFKCHDHYEAIQKEQEYFISLHATLNSIEPMPKPKSKEPHKHILLLCKNNADKFTCEYCQFECSKKSNFELHLITKKHKNCMIVNQNQEHNNKVFTCKKCNKNYNVRNSLWYHEQKCLSNDISLKDKEVESDITISNTTSSSNDIKQLSNLLIEVVKNNSDFQIKILDLCKNMQSVIDTINDSFN